MTIFTSKRPNLDPEPWYQPVVFLRHRDPGFGAIFDPRPEFDFTRDPYPWVAYAYDGSEFRHAGNWHGDYEWAPRHDQFDVPVNPILAWFRREHYDVKPFLADRWARITELGQTPWAVREECTPAQIEHVRKVLTRLANMNKED